MFDVVHQWIRLNELYKLMDFFPNFEFLGENRKILAKIEKYSIE